MIKILAKNLIITGALFKYILLIKIESADEDFFYLILHLILLDHILVEDLFGG